VIKRLRSLLLSPLFWLTLLALPFGSSAAAAVPPCHHAQAMVHEAGVQKTVASPALHVQAGHDRACPAHAAAREHDHGRCACCPACCTGAALAPAPLPAAPDAGPAFVAIPFRAGHVPSVDPALLERPPRPSLA
jgi:hypothetical protein